MKVIFKQTLLASVIAVTSAAQAEVNVTSWGGAYSASQQKAYADTWKGGKVNFINYNGGLGEVKTQVESGAVTWDIVDVLPHEARVGCDEGLFEQLDHSKFTPAANGDSLAKDSAAQRLRGSTNLLVLRSVSPEKHL